MSKMLWTNLKNHLPRETRLGRRRESIIFLPFSIAEFGIKIAEKAA